MGVNQCNFVGRLGKDPEMRYTQEGTPVCSFSIAVDDGYGDKKRTEWFNIVAWKKLAEICTDHLRKGSLCYVSGKMQTQTWEDKDGAKQSKKEVIINQMEMLSKKESVPEVKPEPQDDSEPPF